MGAIRLQSQPECSLTSPGKRGCRLRKVVSTLLVFLWYRERLKDKFATELRSRPNDVCLRVGELMDGKLQRVCVWKLSPVFVLPVGIVL